MVSCSTDYVWWPNTETSSPQLPVLLQNYTHYSGTACYVMYMFIYSTSQTLGKFEITYGVMQEAKNVFLKSYRFFDF